MPVEKSASQLENGQNFEIVNLDADESSHLPRSSPNIYPKSVKLKTFNESPLPENDLTMHSSPKSEPRTRKGAKPHRRSSSEVDRLYDSDSDVSPETMFSNVPLASEPAQEYFGKVKLYNKRSLIKPKRTVSYSDAMNELDIESKHISTEINKMAKGKGLIEDETLPLDLNRLSLTPTQRVLHDTIPPSKEKLMLLSKTRPPWLPPKSKAEEKRHLAEFDKIVSLSKSTANRKQDARRNSETARESDLENASMIWTSHIIPNWDLADSTRQLWWKGIPSSKREVVWCKSFKNPLAVTGETFNHAHLRSQRLIAEVFGNSDLGVKDEEVSSFVKDSVMLVEKDLEETYPELRLFQKGGALYDEAKDICHSYILGYRGDVQFFEGQGSIAATLLISMPILPAFQTFASILNRPLMAALINGDVRNLGRFEDIYRHIFKQRLPQLYNHFSGHFIQPREYIYDLLSSLFAKHASADLVARIYDIWGFEGDEFLLRCIVAFLIHLESNLYVDKAEALRTMRTSILQCAETEFINLIRTVYLDQND